MRELGRLRKTPPSPLGYTRTILALAAALSPGEAMGLVAKCVPCCAVLCFAVLCCAVLCW